MASKAVGLLTFNFGANMEGFTKAMNKAQKKLKRFGKNMVSAGKTMTMGLTLPLVALGKVSIDAFDAQQKAIAQVEAGLKSTGNQVGITSEKLQQMAADLQSKTLFGDEEILKDATAQLLTFTNITGTEFAKTQEMALNLATRLDGDLKSASIMLGKALNDPVKNLSAMTRAGIQFSEEQETLIKSLAESGNMAEAQTLILAELEKQYGGSAEAAALAGSGPIKQLQNELSDLSEQIGARLIPFVKSFVSWITELAKKFDSLSDSQKDNIVKWGLILAAIGPVLIIIGKMSIGISALIPVIAKLGTFLIANPYILLAAAIAAVAFAIYDMTSALTYQIDVQKELGDLNVKAAQSIAKDLVNIDLLTSAIKDETTSLDDKLTALKTLQETYPGYYDEIDETTLSTQNLDAATETLTKNLMQVAKLTAYKDKLVEIQKAMLDLEKKEGVDLTTGIVTDVATNVLLGPLALYAKAVGLATGKTKELNTEIQEKIDKNQYEQLDKLFQELAGETTELEKEVNETNASFKKFQHTTKETVDPLKELEEKTKGVTKETKDLTEETKGLVKELKILPNLAPAIAKAWEDIFPKENKLGNIDRFFERIREDMIFLFGDLEELGDKFQASLNGILGIADAFNEKMRIKAENEDKRKTEAIDLDYERQKAAIENSVMSEEQKSLKLEALDTKTQEARTKLEEETDKKLAKIKRRQAIQNKAMAIVDAVINTATAVTKVLGQAGIFGIPMAAIVGAMGAIQIGIIASTPLPLAEGGLVTGPTQALIGEAGPEVVIPLDRVKSMIGGGEQHITVTGKLIGNDIFLSNSNTGINRLRTV